VTDHFQTIYSQQADRYDRLVRAEDTEGNVPRALAAVAPGEGLVVVDVGTGTGRMARLLAPRAELIVGLDLHGPMLRQQHDPVGPLVQADHQALPVRSAIADLTVAGWAIGHVREWEAERWQLAAGQAIAEMARVTRAGGVIAVLETLGTGSTTPAPPSTGLAEYYAWLENVRGFERQEISTDYAFASVDEAVATLGFFFGPALAERIRANGWSRVPEWTGVWHRTR